MKAVTILTQPQDHHAYLVAAALARKGAVPELLYTEEFPARFAWTVAVDRGSRHVRLSTPTPHTIWLRRPGSITLAEWLDPADRKFAKAEAEQMMGSYLALLGANSFWVNPPTAARRANLKPLQQKAALNVGLETPATLYSNDPNEVRSFLRVCGGKGIYKTFSQTASWKTKEGGLAMTYTSRITEQDLPSDDVLQATPGIYQEEIAKAYELRVTFIGRHPFAAAIRSQETRKGTLDWRRAYDEFKMEPATLPDAIVDACRRLMAEMNLVFGCMDFIVTPDGKYIFLEVNEAGQFLWVEDRVPELKMLDAFSELLIQGRPDFELAGHTPRVSLEDVRSEATQRYEAAIKEHPPRPEEVVEESATV